MQLGLWEQRELMNCMRTQSYLDVSGVCTWSCFCSFGAASGVSSVSLWSRLCVSGVSLKYLWAGSSMNFWSGLYSSMWSYFRSFWSCLRVGSASSTTSFFG